MNTSGASQFVLFGCSLNPLDAPYAVSTLRNPKAPFSPVRAFILPTERTELTGPAHTADYSACVGDDYKALDARGTNNRLSG